MSVLVEDLLLLARLDEGRPLEREPVDLDEVAAEAVEMARAVDPARPIELDAERLTVLGDRDRLRQVVDNLLGNTRSHTPAGTPVRVASARDEGQRRLEVADEGPGMSAEEASTSSSASTAPTRRAVRNSGGVGLGLSIVSAVTEAHGGVGQGGERARPRDDVPRPPAARSLTAGRSQEAPTRLTRRSHARRES